MKFMGTVSKAQKIFSEKSVEKKKEKYHELENEFVAYLNEWRKGRENWPSFDILRESKNFVTNLTTLNLAAGEAGVQISKDATKAIEQTYRKMEPSLVENIEAYQEKGKARLENIMVGHEWLEEYSVLSNLYNLIFNLESAVNAAKVTLSDSAKSCLQDVKNYIDILRIPVRDN